jgi:hypothetical protein
VQYFYYKKNFLSFILEKFDGILGRYFLLIKNVNNHNFEKFLILNLYQMVKDIVFKISAVHNNANGESQETVQNFYNKLLITEK